MNLKRKLTVAIVILSMILFVFIVIGKIVEKETTINEPTMETFLQNALTPVGSTMYIWGGGWNEEDESSGATSMQLGLRPEWRQFAKEQDATYDYEQHRFERENGLDCSGYVGWVIYNTFETENKREGYVTKSTEFAESLANRGWGRLIKNPKNYLPGDIVSMDGHVWICLGTCSDGSVLLVHSSPPGVSVCGTQIAENESSVAIDLATEFMKTYFPEWQEKYPNRMVPSTYLESVVAFRWSENTLTGALEYQRLSGEDVLSVMLQKE